MREQPRFDAEGARRAGYSETEILAFLSQNRMLGDIAVNNAGHVMIFREGAWSRAPVAQNQQGEQIFYDGAAWKPVPAAWEKASAQTEVGPLPPGFVLETPGRSTGAGPMIEVQLPDGRVIEFPPDTAPDVMQRVTTQAAQQQPEPPAPQRGFGESLARVVSQIDTLTVVFFAAPPSFMHSLCFFVPIPRAGFLQSVGVIQIREMTREAKFRFGHG
jgi:hypothetical protein